MAAPRFAPPPRSSAPGRPSTLAAIADPMTNQSTASTHSTPPTRESGPLFITQRFRPYCAPYEVLELVKLQASVRTAPSPELPMQQQQVQRQPLSASRVQQIRQTAVSFIERVGARLGFPRRTIATAQLLYHRFHLHFPLREFPSQDVGLAALLVGSKLEDTLKKLREIQIAAWQVNHQIEGGSAMGEGDSSIQEAHRPNLIAIERLILQTLSFNFNLYRSLSPPDELLALPPTGRGDLFTYVVRTSLSLGCSTAYTSLAYTIAIDLQRTLAGLSYPPHVCAAACVWLASFLTLTHRNGKEWRDDELVEGDDKNPSFDGNWCEAEMSDLRDIAQSLVSVFQSLSPAPLSTPHPLGVSPSFSPSPFSPIEPAPPTRPSHAPSSISTERDKMLLLTGVPHTISLSLAQRGSLAASGAFTGVPRRVDEWQKVQIALRRHAPASLPASEDPSSVGRWNGAKEGLLEVISLVAERDRKDQARWEREKARIEAREKGLAGVEIPTEEQERERERALRPGSVLYHF